jgi:nucleotide-binding universal stress UspA family protein
VETVLLEGGEFDQIDLYAREQRVNLIVVGAGEPTDTGKVFLGTTAARLRRWASTPVWIVRPDTAPPIRRIFCPVDMLPASTRALKNAIHFARKFDADLTVLNVRQSPLGGHDDLLELQGEMVEGPPEVNEPHVEDFDAFLAKFDFHEVRCRKVIRRGKAQDEVARMARELQPDVTVMGSAGRSTIAHMFIGGVARRLAQELASSIITVRAREAIEVTADSELPQLDADFCASHPEGHDCRLYQHGEQLLAQGLADEAVEHFGGCVTNYGMCANAWGRLAEAHRRLGAHEKAQECEANADEALRWQERRRIEDELRSGHVLHRRLCGL